MENLSSKEPRTEGLSVQRAYGACKGSDKRGCVGGLQGFRGFLGVRRIGRVYKVYDVERAYEAYGVQGPGPRGDRGCKGKRHVFALPSETPNELRRKLAAMAEELQASQLNCAQALPGAFEVEGLGLRV